ncbi:MAG: cupin domain-containing protein [Gammaproteobacteria bacterium]|nr:cupin domain-containing protein [Gammaproteobacteria bacterium]MDE0443151.1 cupin domain-containing protein [Gammaproteobacteria bacterium]
MSDDTAGVLNPVANIGALRLEGFRKGSGYESADAPFSDAIGLSKIGARYIEVPPGKSSCPFHVHHVEEEMFFILEGKGSYRFGEATYEVGPGDVLGAPCGGAEFAHKLTNTGDSTLKYLAISTRSATDVCEYPDSGKFGVGTHFGDLAFRFIGRGEDSCDYWDGEPDAQD